MRLRHVLLLAVLAAALCPGAASAADVPAGARQTVTVNGGSFSLPFVPAARDTGTIQGDPGTQLAGYLSETVTVPQATVDSSTAPGFAMP